MKTKILKTVADVETAMNELVRSKAALDKRTAEANMKIADIRDEYTEDISALEEEVKRLESSIETWADEHRDDEELFPNGKKSFELQAGTISFRKGAAKVVLAKRKKLADVVEFLANITHKSKALWKQFLTTPAPTLDKSAVKKAYDEGDVTDEDLAEIGLAIEEGEETTKIDLKEVEAYS